MAHVVLLGDSIFDNGAYVGGAPDVIRQLKARVPPGWQATLRAVDGAVIRGVRSQIAAIPAEASHLVISVGGNDALGYAAVLEQGARSMAEAVDKLGAIARSFDADYAAMLDLVLALGLPTAVSTIYYPRFPDPRRQELAVTALAIPNDCIVRAAFARGLPLLDLRLICDSDADYANPIEPSAIGGEKIATAIARLVAEHDFTRRRCEVFAG